MKKLAIAQTPITSFLHEAYTCNVVLSEPIGYMWLYDTWIQWEWRSRVLDGCMPETISWKLPLTKWYAIPNILLSKSGASFISLVKAAIDRGLYITTCVNENELSSVAGASERHDILIHGYDEKKNNAYVMTYDRRGLYGECVCSLDELAASYETVSSRILWDEDTIVLVQRKELYFYRTDLLRMRDLLEDYLFSRSCWWRFNGNPCPDKEDPTQGLNAYKQVIEYIRTLDKNNAHLDIRSFCTVCDHKHIMYERIKYLERMGYIDPRAKLSGKYDPICKDAERVKLLALKYAMTADMRLLDSLIRLLSQLKDSEEEVLTEVLSRINERCTLLNQYEEIPSELYDSWLGVSRLACCTVPVSSDGEYVTLKNGDSITAWDINLNAPNNFEQMRYASISYKIANVRGEGKIEAYLDMTGSPPVSILNLDELSETQIKTADICYEIPPATQLIRSDIHYYVQGDENFSVDLYAISLNRNSDNT